MPDTANTRDHLANERTFLAWMRTGLAMLGFGILLVKLRFLGLTPGEGVRSARLGLAFAAAGVLTFPLAAWHHARARRLIDGGGYKAASHVVYTFAAAVFVLGLASLAYLVSLSGQKPPSAPPRMGGF